ncbi:MAG: HAMP domain-containing protein [Clostridia bacterium]|nr:HAMP domain-containing protein [Clostridia bacterium]HKM23016.1 ATP-binding protein [Lachnospiraceae bacterium]
MKLKTKLTITACTIVILPIILATCSILVLGVVQMRNIKTTYGIEEEGSSYGIMLNPVQAFSKVTRNIYEQLSRTADVNPSLLQDKEYLRNVNSELQSKSSYLIIRIGNENYYIGNEDDFSTVASLLPKYENGEFGSAGDFYFGDIQRLLKKIDFTSADGDQGSVLIITKVTSLMPNSFILNVIMVITLILILTSVLMTSWTYRSIVIPVNKLNKAMQNIADGNLDFTIEADSDDEIGHLCRDFEEMRKRLKESTESKVQYDTENRELVSNISHDLKTPITAIKGYVEGIMDGVADTPEKMDKYIKTIYNKANEMDRLINELTLYSRIDTNRIPYNFHRINVDEYFRDCVEEVGMELEDKNITLHYMNYLDKDVRIIADPEQLRRVINNIIGNSVKYIDKPRGIVNIHIIDIGDAIQVEIEDNGKGIATKDLPSIFERFYRTDASRNSSQGGSGIGLSIVKKIIEDHGGYIWATSKEGIGTTIHFCLRKYREVIEDEQNINS